VSLRRYASGTRPTPDPVAQRLHLLALIVADLRGAYNDYGIRRWFQRPRPQLGGHSSEDVLPPDWTAGSSEVAQLRTLAVTLLGSPVTWSFIAITTRSCLTEGSSVGTVLGNHDNSCVIREIVMGEVATIWGRLHGVKTTIDAAGRVVIPREIRLQAGLRPGMILDVRWHDGHIEIEPETLPVTLVREGRFLVAVPQEANEPLTAQTVEETRRALVEERAAEA
jgi:AbrB family looped-hinge helix DNA binding protein